MKTITHFAKSVVRCISMLVIISLATLNTGLSETLPIASNEVYDTQLILLNTYLQEGNSANASLNISLIHERIVENGNIGEHALGFRLYTEILCLLEREEYGTAVEKCLNLLTSSSFKQFRDYLNEKEDLNARGLYAIGTVEELASYVEGRVAESQGNKLDAELYYEQCQLFFDSYSRIEALDNSDQGKSLHYVFKDEGVETAVCKALDKREGTITEDDLAQITELYASDYEIYTLEDLSFMKNLEWLVVDGNNISDITPLQGLSKLKNLDICNNYDLSDITALKNMKELRSLCLMNCNVEDLTPITSLTSLETLIIANCPVYYISPLKKLIQLRYLDLGGTFVIDIEELHGLVALDYLDLTGTLVTDACMLPNLSSMTILPEELKDGLPILASNSFEHLDIGAKGEAVKSIQESLIDLGYLEDTADGVYGPKTQKAIADFQAANNIYGAAGVATNFTQKRIFGANPVAKGATINKKEALGNEGEIRVEAIDNQNNERLWVTINDNLCDDSVIWIEISFFGVDANENRIYGDTYFSSTAYMPTNQYGDCIRIEGIPQLEQIEELYYKVTAIMYQDGRLWNYYPEEKAFWEDFWYMIKIKKN